MTAKGNDHFMKLFANSAFVIIITTLLMYSCVHGKSATQGITEGTVIYKIQYPDNVTSNGLSFLLPSEMTLRFSNGNQIATFRSNINLYGLDFLHTSECDSFYTLLKILEKRVYVPSSKASSLFIFGQTEGFDIQFDKSITREIAGFQCKKAEIVPFNKNRPAFSIWYTKEIGIPAPYKNTPFENIPGIMLEFEMVYENVVFHLEAQRVLSEKHARNLFKVPTNYEKTTLSEIEGLIQTVLR